MELALDLAKTHEGLTGTNPSVGCVIVKNDNIISIGKTSINGRPHAELNAIQNCTEDLTNSKIYVTLEPCSHYGVTLPCTTAIINSKISEVIYSIEDIDKRVCGKTYKLLSSKNIKVKKGLLKSKISNFYSPYFFNRKYKFPYVTGKIAISNNNLIYSKNKKKITNKKSDQLTHLLRYKNDSIMISYKTLNVDNPKLSCRLKNKSGFSPKRVILDNKLESNNNSYIYKTANKSNTIIFYNQANKSKILKFKKNNIFLIKSKINKYNQLDIKLVLKKLYNLGCRNILIEGGNELTKNFLTKKLFNQFFLFKSIKKLSKMPKYVEFNGLNILKRNYKNKFKINSNFGKDIITLYKNTNV